MRFGLSQVMAVLLGLAVPACGGQTSPATDQSGPLPIAVSILPQKYFVERIGGPTVRVSVLIGPGQSPDTYDPTPRQMVRLSGTRLYFTMGLEFERAWLGRMHAAHPEMTLVDMRRGIPLLPLEDASDPGHDSGQDPHLWMSPRLVEVMAGTIRDALVEAMPERRDLFELNHQRFVAQLARLDREIQGRLAGLPTRTFMAFHPAWGYFARDYGLHQIAIESHGKEPGARTLARLIDQGRNEHIGLVLVQAQFSRAMAETVAQAVGARVLTLDPLAEDYMNNLEQAAQQLADALRGT